MDLSKFSNRNYPILLVLKKSMTSQYRESIFCTGGFIACAANDFLLWGGGQGGREPEQIRLRGERSLVCISDLQYVGGEAIFMFTAASRARCRK